LFTCWVSDAELARNPVPGEYSATIEWLPSPSDERLWAAWPLPFNATPDANTVDPFLKVTLPEVTGVESAFTTVAVNVTIPPVVDGFTLLVRVVVVATVVGETSMSSDQLPILLAASSVTESSAA